MYGFGLVPGTVFLGTPFFVLVDQLCFRRGGSVSRDAAQEVGQGFLDGAGAFERFEVDALQR